MKPLQVIQENMTIHPSDLQQPEQTWLKDDFILNN